GNTVKVVWYGTANIYRGNTKGSIEATYPVMFASSGDKVTLPTFGLRYVEYKLYAAVSTVVDLNNTVLTTKYAVTADSAVASTTQLIPYAQAYIRTLVTRTYHG
ncbi:MAG: hypothetical protein K2N18_04375, partial [Clostridia bacterium]|nr:hypothetical protein [Clostridia bacterium]